MPLRYSDMKISLVVPVLNESANIHKLLDSINKQTVLPDELIFVDGYSTDVTVPLIKCHAVTKKVFTKIIQRRPYTIADARQIGAVNANGNVLVFTDGDSFFSEEFFEVVKKYMADSRYDFLYGQVIFTEKSLYMYFLKLMYFIILHGLRAFRIPLVFGSCMAVTANGFYRICGFNTELAYGEDNDIALRCGNVKYVNAMKVYTSGRRFNTFTGLLRHCGMVFKYIYWKITGMCMPTRYIHV